MTGVDLDSRVTLNSRAESVEVKEVPKSEGFDKSWLLLALSWQVISSFKRAK